MGSYENKGLDWTGLIYVQRAPVYVNEMPGSQQKKGCVIVYHRVHYLMTFEATSLAGLPMTPLSNVTAAVPYAYTTTWGKKKNTKLPQRIGMSHFCQVAGKHSPDVCNLLSACTVSIKCVLAFWVGFTTCIRNSALILIPFGQQLLDICLVFHHLNLGERLQSPELVEKWCWQHGDRLFPVGYTLFSLCAP